MIALLTDVYQDASLCSAGVSNRSYPPARGGENGDEHVPLWVEFKNFIVDWDDADSSALDWGSEAHPFFFSCITAKLNPEVSHTSLTREMRLLK